VVAVGRGLHLHIAALGVLAGGAPRSVDGGVGVLAVQGAAAGQGALHVVWTRGEDHVLKGPYYTTRCECDQPFTSHFKIVM